MQTKDAIRQTLELSSHVLSTYVSDLSDVELLSRPHAECNSIAWQLGHLISSEVSLLNMIEPGSAPELPEGFAEKHAREAARDFTPGEFCSLVEYQRLTTMVHEAFYKLLENYPEEKFDDPAPEFIRKTLPTMGSLFLLIASHPLMHAGQFVPVRRALGKPVLI